jgi:hypothetical protein
MTSTIPKRIIAVNPGMQYLGIAVLEGENLLWYSVKTFPGRKTLPSMRLEVQQFLAQLFQKYSPSVLVVEEPFYAQSLLSDNLKKLTRNIKTWGRWKGLRVQPDSCYTRNLAIATVNIVALLIVGRFCANALRTAERFAFTKVAPVGHSRV